MRIPNSPRAALQALAVAIGCLVLASCGKGGEEAAKPSGQVVARIGDDVVTTQELDNEFRLANVPNDRRKDPDIVKRVLGEIVARKYLARQALNAKLDREPAVLLDILRSREQVLAGAQLARNVAAKASAITKADVDKYIANNPGKFSARQVYDVDEVIVPLVPNIQTVVAATQSMNTLEEVEAKLTEMSVPHNRITGTVSSSEMSEELAQAIRTKTPNDIFFTRSGQNGVFLKILNQETKPLEGAAADALARQLMRADFFRNEAAVATFSANMEAKYEGDYAGIMGTPGAPPKTQ
jgi:EpsD family peptidyl-prolyl cis-trans isomerase